MWYDAFINIHLYTFTFPEVNVMLSDTCLQGVLLISFHGWNTNWVIREREREKWLVHVCSELPTAISHAALKNCLNFVIKLTEFETTDFVSYQNKQSPKLIVIIGW